MAAAITNFPSATFLSALGEPFARYFAQTFKAKPGLLTELTIELEGEPQMGPDDLDFRVLITEVQGAGLTFHPTAVLSESATITFSSTASASIVHVSLPNLSLVPGTTYAFTSTRS